MMEVPANESDEDKTAAEELPVPTTSNEPSRPTIYEAERTTDGSGLVEFGNDIDETRAVAYRQAGQDIVVRGDDTTVNRNLAGKIEGQVGPPSKAQFPHKSSAGGRALPHFHQQSRNPAGHSFYETDKLKARKKK